MPHPDRNRELTIPPVEAFLEGPIALVDSAGVPEQYHVFDRESAQAIRAALAAKRPLLVRGEPGVGKTQLAAAAAKVLKRPLVPYVVDARTESRNLLWSFDAVMRLADAQAASSLLNPLYSSGSNDEEGIAGSLARNKEMLRTALDVADYVRPGPLWWAFDWDSALKQAERSKTAKPSYDGPDDPQNGRVVLIDEIDKADTDVPNGLLEALGAGQFSPQGQPQPVRIVGPVPLVIVTTNEERVLPAAFVRRCFVLHLRLPDDQESLVKLLVERAHVHFPHAGQKSEPLFQKAARVIAEERALALERFVKPLPGQAEYLDLLRAVLELAGSPTEQEQLVESLAHYVLKKQESLGA
jgi:MoxR-like ATPase